MLYIDAMKEAMDDEEFDPRRNSHLKSAKNGQFKTNRRGAFIPKNPLTVMYLCHAYEMAVWLSKVASRKHDVEGKKVSITTRLTSPFYIVAVNTILA
jgi:hypothetical protein